MGEINYAWRMRGFEVASPRFSDLVMDWLRGKIGNMHDIDIVPVMRNFVDGYSIRVDGILIGWVDDATCIFELASGEALRRGEVRRRHEELVAADPKLFDEIWARMQLIDRDCVEANGYSFTEYKNK